MQSSTSASLKNSVCAGDFFKEKGLACDVIDEDVFRRQYSQDLGFSEKNRDTNIQRMAQRAKPQLNDYNYVNTPLAICEQRDVKGLYKKARAGEIQLFTGINSPISPRSIQMLRVSIPIRCRVI